MEGNQRNWDVYADERSQVYGGMSDETDKSRLAVNATQGIVVAYAPEGQEPHVFKAYFSACCGGIFAVGGRRVQRTLLRAAPGAEQPRNLQRLARFTWGPVVISKQELSRRFRVWGQAKGRPEQNIGLIQQVAVQYVNPWGRPDTIQRVRRQKIPTASPPRSSAAPATAMRPTPSLRQRTRNVSPPILLSKLRKVITDADAIRFVEGHGNGHGVGLCNGARSAAPRKAWSTKTSCWPPIPTRSSCGPIKISPGNVPTLAIVLLTVPPKTCLLWCRLPALHLQPERLQRKRES